MIVVTGAAGLFGVNFVKYILQETNETILAIDSLFGGNIDYLPVHDRVVFMKGDLSDKTFQTNLENGIFKKSPIKYVFHFAAYAAEGLSPFIRCFNYQNNLIGTAFVVNMCIQYNVKRLVFTSSMAVYGDQEAPFHEEMTPRPIDPYGVAKFASEMDIQIAAKQHGLEFCILRPHNVYGPYQNIWDPYRNVLGIWMYKSLKGLPISIYGDGSQKRAFSYIGDVVPCLWRAARDERAKNQIINLGGIQAYTIKESAEIMRTITGNESIEHLVPRHEVKNAYSTYQKSIDCLDFIDSTSLSDGLAKMWNWAKSQPDKEQKRWSKYEINRLLYSFWK